MTAFARSELFAPRPVVFLGPLESDGWRLKIYSIVYGSQPFQRASFDQGLALAVESLPRPAVTAARPGVGFVILHQGRGMDYVVLSWWDNENEYFNRVFVRSADEPDRWRRACGGESACVWDLGVIWHERNAYVRHVLSAPAGPDLDAYLADRHATLPDRIAP